MCKHPTSSSAIIQVSEVLSTQLIRKPFPREAILNLPWAVTVPPVGTFVPMGGIKVPTGGTLFVGKSGEVVLHVFLVEMCFDIGGVALQHAAYLLLLCGIEHPLAVLVAVVGSLASEIVGQGDTEVVTSVAALYLAVDLGKAACHHYFLCFLVVQASLFATRIWEHARPSRMLFRCLKECLVAKAPVLLLAVVAWTEGPPFWYFLEIDHCMWLQML